VLRLRRQLPVFSPVRFASLLSGVTGALGVGRPRARLEAQLQERFQADDVRLTDSGTSALRLALEAAVDIAPDAEAGRDVVLLPAYCCYDVATAAVGAGVRVRLYDLDPVTLGPDWPSLEAGLKGGAAAVVVVHLFGIPVDVERCARLATAAGALLIEDAAQAFGGRSGDRPLGALGSLGVLSFGRGKGVTGGGGGALLANDAAGREALERVRARPGPGGPGWLEIAHLAAQWLFGRPSLYGLPASLPWLGLGKTRYRRPWPPRDIARGPAAATVSNWRVALAEAGVRRERARRLGDLAPVNMAAAVKAGACPLRLPVSSADTSGRSVLSPSEIEGVVRSYPKPLGALPPAADWERPDGGCPGAEFLAMHLLTAPTHSRSRPDRVRRVLTADRVREDR